MEASGFEKFMTDAADEVRRSIEAEADGVVQKTPNAKAAIRSLPDFFCRNTNGSDRLPKQVHIDSKAQQSICQESRSYFDSLDCSPKCCPASVTQLAMLQGVCPSFCSSLLHTCKREGNELQVAKTEGSTVSEEKWSLLPAILLWMIKDKLDVFDDMQLSAVCHGWWGASALYPNKKQSVGDGMPWIMQFTELRSSVREFICITRKKRFTVDLPELMYSTVVSSKQGWILMNSKKLYMFLINPVTKDIIKMPHVEELSQLYVGSFSTTHEGYPRCVVLWYYARINDKVTIRTANPGDQAWTEHSYVHSYVQRRQPLSNLFPILVIIGEHVYCFITIYGWGVVLNMDSKLWKELSMDVGEPGSSRFVCMVEFEGKLVQLYSRNFTIFSAEFRFYRYNDTESSWERLNNDAVKDTRWFPLGHRFLGLQPGLCASDKGLKVYYSTAVSKSEYCHARDFSDGKIPFSPWSENIFINHVVHDVMDGSADIIESSFPIGQFAKWVDIG